MGVFKNSIIVTTLIPYLRGVLPRTNTIDNFLRCLGRWISVRRLIRVVIVSDCEGRWVGVFHPP